MSIPSTPLAQLSHSLPTQIAKTVKQSHIPLSGVTGETRRTATNAPTVEQSIASSLSPAVAQWITQAIEHIQHWMKQLQAGLNDFLDQLESSLRQAVRQAHATPSTSPFAESASKEESQATFANAATQTEPVTVPAMATRSTITTKGIAQTTHASQAIQTEPVALERPAKTIAASRIPRPVHRTRISTLPPVQPPTDTLASKTAAKEPHLTNPRPIVNANHAPSKASAILDETSAQDILQASSQLRKADEAVNTALKALEKRHPQLKRRWGLQWYAGAGTLHTQVEALLEHHQKDLKQPAKALQALGRDATKLAAIRRNNPAVLADWIAIMQTANTNSLNTLNRYLDNNNRWSNFYRWPLLGASRQDVKLVSQLDDALAQYQAALTQLPTKTP